MALVKVMLFATLRRKYKTRELKVECNGTLEDLIEKTSKILGHEFISDVYDLKRGKVREDIILMINGRNLKDLKSEIVLKDNDVIAVFPPIAGG
ncbi:MAG: MoaD/ThiS family protein [Nitrososphaerota archaeon]|nr:MoaD/ThiS family protein [Nitrososphaerota archaeon]